MAIPVRGVRQLRKGRFSQPGGIYFVTVSTFQRQPRFTKFNLACAMCRQFHALAMNEDSEVMCWVVMPDHIHLLAQLGELSLGSLVQRLKSRSAVLLNRELSTGGQFWSKGYYDHALRRDESIRAVSDYIIHNPVRAGLARHPGEYPFWDAAWL